SIPIQPHRVQRIQRRGVGAGEAFVVQVACAKIGLAGVFVHGGAGVAGDAAAAAGVGASVAEVDGLRRDLAGGVGFEQRAVLVVGLDPGGFGAVDARQGGAAQR